MRRPKDKGVRLPLQHRLITSATDLRRKGTEHFDAKDVDGKGVAVFAAELLEELPRVGHKVEGAAVK